MEFNDEISLIHYETGLDNIGNSKKRTTFKRIVLCAVRSVMRNEYYKYGADELRPEYTVTLNLLDYENEKECELRGKKYKIVRTYEVDRDLIELTISK